jgi:transaldolase
LQLTLAEQTVVCDSGDFATIDKYKPQDATTNPSLILAASKKPEYEKLIDAAVAWGKKHGDNVEDQVDASLDNLLVQFGKEILNVVPGKVSTEVDARFSFDTKASVNKALRIIDVCLIPHPKKPTLRLRLTFSSCTRSRASARSAF